jgi:hypothetical protein
VKKRTQIIMSEAEIKTLIKAELEKAVPPGTKVDIIYLDVDGDGDVTASFTYHEDILET